MGQPVGVILKPSSTSAGVLRFEANRNLTGMGHERFAVRDDAVGDRPAAVLARRLFDSGKVAGVHVFGNMVTVSLAAGHTSDGLASVVEGLYTYYVPGFVPPPLELSAEMAAAPAAAADPGGVASGFDPRVPTILIERSRLGKERWFAKQAEG